MRDYLELTKPRITILILICTAVGYMFGSGNFFRLSILVHALLGTALLASARPRSISVTKWNPMRRCGGHACAPSLPEE